MVNQRYDTVLYDCTLVLHKAMVGQRYDNLRYEIFHSLIKLWLVRDMISGDMKYFIA